MSAGPIRSILVVGGGTAGWLAAAYLQRALSDDVTITLIESSDVDTVGVGEATIPTLVNTLAFLGIHEDAFLQACQGSFKAAIKYINWARDTHAFTDEQDDNSFYHPFFDRPEQLATPYAHPHFPFLGEGFSTAQLLMRDPDRRNWTRFDREVSSIPALCDAMRFGKLEWGNSRYLLYAYHLDAGRFASMLREIATKRGVKHCVGHVANVELDERGQIRALQTRDGREFTADLFIDCSGFRGLLINGALGERFIDDGQFLPVNAAVALLRRNDPEREGLAPYTVARAMPAGWSWRVPLMERDGCGYVYNDAFASQDEAERDLRVLLGPGAVGLPARHLRMRVGRNPRSWVANCVAIGLSSFFIEPLESTAIFSIEFQLAQLVNLFPDRDFAPVRAREYNRRLEDLYNHLRDFIVMHYCTTQRERDPFWRHMKYDAKVPDSLAEILEGYAVGMLPDDNLHWRLFRARSYACVLSGMGVYPQQANPTLAHLDPGALQAILDATQLTTRALLERVPLHHDYLSSL